MRRALVVVMLVALASVAAADFLHYSGGGKREGALVELTFAVEGMPRIYIRDDVKSIEVDQEGKDTAKLADGRTVEGKLTSVRFKLTEGETVFPRKEVKAVEVTEGTEVEEWKPPTDKPKLEEEPEKEEKLTPEQKQAIVKNKELYEAQQKKADELHSKDIEEFSRKYKSKWDEANRQIESSEKAIERKMERRRTADRTYDSGSRYRSEYDRLVATDQIEEDRRALEKARSEVSKMKKMLKEGRGEIDKKDDLRQKRVLSVGKGNRGEILSGNVLTDEQMAKRYEAALDIGSKSSSKKN